MDPRKAGQGSVIYQIYERTAADTDCSPTTCRQRSKHVTYITLFNPRINPSREALPPGPFRNWGKQRHGEVKQLPQDHISSQGHSWESNSGALSLKLRLLTTTPCGLLRPENPFFPIAVQRTSINVPSIL